MNPFFSRRQMLKSASCGFGYLALMDLLSRTYGVERSASPLPNPPSVDGEEKPKHYQSPLIPKQPHFAAKAKRIIFLFMQGAPSHVDMWDYKPKLIADDGKSYGGRTLLAPQWKFKQHGKSGMWVSELFPNIANHADDMCMINSMNNDNPAHAQATVMMHTGSTRFVRPSMGSWLLYGLGTENQNLPGFITINPPGGVGGAQNYGSAFLPAAYEGTRIEGANPKGMADLASSLPPTSQRRQIDLIQSMNRDLLRKSGDNPQIEGVIESFELGFRMQSTVPSVMDLSKESPATHAMYGIGAKETDTFGRQCLLARRFAESGVRFIEVAHTGWDQHRQLREKHSSNAAAVDKPVAALLTDLKQRGLLKDTIVLFGGEFGRTPGAQNRDGRDHNAKGYSMWMAGGGVKSGITYGATDDYGYKAAVNPMHVHDLHATILNLMGLDHERLTYRYAGRDFRLTDVFGNVAKPIIT